MTLTVNGNNQTSIITPLKRGYLKTMVMSMEMTKDMEEQLKAYFRAYPTDAYKLIMFVWKDQEEDFKRWLD
jgi:hypothetical protein